MSVEWPEGWQETPPNKRVRSQFANPTHGRAISYVLDEIQRLGRALKLGASDVKVTTDHERFRRDGLPYSGERPASPAVAVWFRLAGSPHVMACDAYTRHEDNLWAIGKTIEAKRGILRWKSATGEREFAGYAALPSGDGFTDGANVPPRGMAPRPVQAPAHVVLGINPDADALTAKTAYKALVLKHHPDRPGGDVEAFQRVQDAWARWNEPDDGKVA